MQDQVEPARTLEGPVDQFGSAVAGEDKDHPFIHLNAVQSAQEHRLVFGFVNGLAVPQGQVHVIEEDNAAALDAEKILDAVTLAGLTVQVRRDQPPFPAPAAGFLPDLAAGTGLCTSPPAPPPN